MRRSRRAYLMGPICPIRRVQFPSFFWGEGCPRKGDFLNPMQRYEKFLRYANFAEIFAKKRGGNPPNLADTNIGDFKRKHRTENGVWHGFCNYKIGKL